MRIKNIREIVRDKNFKQGVLYTTFSFSNSGISFILLLILARYISPKEYGSLNLFTTFTTLLNIIISLSTTSYVAVSFFGKKHEDFNQVLQVVFLCTTGVLLIFSAIMATIPKLFSSIVGIEVQFLWMGLIICYLQIFNTVNLDIWRLEEKPMCYGLYCMSFAVCNFFLTFWFIVGMNYGWEGRVYAWTLLAIIYFVISIGFLIKRRYLVLKVPKTDIFKETLIYALPLIPHSASFWLKQGMDRYIINYFHDQTSVGYFSIAMNLAAIIGIVGNAFNASNSVFIYKQLTIGYAKVSSVLKRQTRLMTGVFILVSLLVCVGAYTLVSLFLPKYINSLPYILPLCVGAFFQCIYLLWVNYIFFYKRTKKLMLVTFSTAVMQVLLSIWLTRYNILYTAYISMFISAITMLLVRSASQKLLN